MNIIVGPYAIRRDGPNNWTIIKVGPNNKIEDSGLSYQKAKALCRKWNQEEWSK